MTKDGFMHNASFKEEQSSDDVQMEDFAATVADKWRGTAADKHDMMMLGRAQVLRVRTHQVPLQAFRPTGNCSETSASFPSSVFPLCLSAHGSSFSREYRS